MDNVTSAFVLWKRKWRRVREKIKICRIYYFVFAISRYTYWKERYPKDFINNVKFQGAYFGKSCGKAEDLKMDLTERRTRTVLSCVVTFAVVCLKCVHGELVLSDFSSQVWYTMWAKIRDSWFAIVDYNVKSMPPSMFLILVALCVFREPYINL